MRRLVVLRPEPGASRTLELARSLGIDAVSVPLFRVEPIDWRAPDPNGFDGLLLTSANAVRHAGALLGRFRALPVYAVGEATADAARSAGFEVRAAGPGGVDDLLAEIPPRLRLLHPCGEDWRRPGRASQRIVDVPVYRAVALPAPATDFAGAVVAVHSPRAGRRLAEVVGADRRASIAVAAISGAAAAAAGTGWEKVESAAAANDPALLALAARLCNKRPVE